MYAAFDMNSNSNGWVTTNAQNGKVVNGVRIAPMLCPASPLPEFRARVTGYDLTLLSYVGNLRLDE